jgi:hypothetical protein
VAPPLVNLAGQLDFAGFLLIPVFYLTRTGLVTEFWIDPLNQSKFNNYIFYCLNSMFFFNGIEKNTF